jgi:hypothetical protein
MTEAQKWSNLEVLAAEIDTFAAILLSDAGPAPVPTLAPRDASWLGMRAHWAPSYECGGGGSRGEDNCYFMFAASNGNGSGIVTFHFPQELLVVGNLTVAGMVADAGRHIPVVKNEFNDSFERLDVRVYRALLKPTANREEVAETRVDSRLPEGTLEQVAIAAPAATAQKSDDSDGTAASAATTVTADVRSAGHGYSSVIAGHDGRTRHPLKTDIATAVYDSGADLTGSWRLFVDDEELLNMSRSVHRKYGQFAKFDGNPVAVGALYGSVLRTADGGYAMYHECGDTVCFSNSSDGIVWTNPKLGKEIRGGQYGPRNVLLARQGSAEKPNQRCTAAMGTLAKTAPGCTDTQPSVLYTPWESNAKYQMYNFVSLLSCIFTLAMPVNQNLGLSLRWFMQRRTRWRGVGRRRRRAASTRRWRRRARPPTAGSRQPAAAAGGCRHVPT